VNAGVAGTEAVVWEIFGGAVVVVSCGVEVATDMVALEIVGFPKLADVNQDDL
jgi:hypothetical protein